MSGRGEGLSHQSGETPNAQETNARDFIRKIANDMGAYKEMFDHRYEAKQRDARERSKFPLIEELRDTINTFDLLEASNRLNATSREFHEIKDFMASVKDVAMKGTTYLSKEDIQNIREQNENVRKILRETS